MALLYRMGTGNGSGGDLKPYIVQFTCDSAFDNQELVMHYEGTPHAGETVEDVSGIIINGTLTLYPLHDGVWSISVTSVGGNAFSDMITLEKWGTYNVSVSDIGYGDWLKAADIADTFGSLENVLADEKTVRELMTKHASADKLIQWYNANPSKFPLSTFTSSRIAMKWIGLRDYICDKMLAINALRIALINSTYKNYILFESVNGIPIIEVEGAPSGYGRLLNESVPVMTGDTTPIGEAISKTNPTEAFNAFDNNSNTAWNGGVDNNCDIGYKSIKSICVKSIIIGDEENVSSTMGDNTRLKNFIVQGSNSGEFNGEEEDIYVGIYEKKKTDLSNALQKFDFIDNNKNFLYHRVLIIDKYASESNSGIRVTKLQFYGVSYSEEEFGDDGIEMLYDHGVKMCDFVATFDETMGHPTITEESDHILFEVPPYNRFTVTQYIAQKEINNSDSSFKYSIHESSYCSVSQAQTQRGDVCLTKNHTGYGEASSETDIMTNTNTAYKRKIINKIDAIATPYASFSSRALGSGSYTIKWVKLYLIKKGA